MRRWVLVALVLLTTVGWRAPAADAAPAGACGTGSWVAGTVDLCSGELVYRDYVYDDFGAAQSPPIVDLTQIPAYQPTRLPTFDAYGGMPSAGGERYPAGEENTADLVAFRLRVAGGEVHVAFELNTMFRPDRAIAAIAIDTDDDRSTGGGAWPGVHGVSSDGWDVERTFTAGDPSTNTITGSFPQPPGSRWRVQALVARADGTVMNVAFRGTDETGFWWENHQATALAAGDVSGFGTTVAVADLTGGVTRRADPPAGQVQQRVYVSTHPVPPGEGISMPGVPGPAHNGDDPLRNSISQAFNFLGRYQPYGFYLPRAAGPHGVQLLMHGLAENHSARLYAPWAPQHHITDQIGEARNRILVSPLGRGWKGWYSSYSERDVLDALADVEATYPVDAGRVFAGGYSMGGYGTYRLASLHPDLFAGYISWVGYTGDCFNGTPIVGYCGVGADTNVVDLVGNLGQVPGPSLFAGADELVTAPTSAAMCKAFLDGGVPGICYLHPAAEHMTLAAADDWRKESDWTATLVRGADPVHIRFRTDRRWFFPDLGIVPDRAWWVSSIVPAGDGYADVDARTIACGRPDVVGGQVQPGAGPSPVPWVSTEVPAIQQPALPAANRIELTVANVASLRVDAGRACLSSAAIAWKVTADRDVTIVLTDGRSFTVAAGTHEGTLPAVGAATSPPAPAPPPDGTLPATGSETALPLAAAAALLAAALAARRLTRRG